VQNQVFGLSEGSDLAGPEHVRPSHGGFIAWGGHGRDMSAVTEVKQRHEARLMKMRGVVGVGIGQKDGKDIIRIYVEKENPKILSRIPHALDNVPVEVVVSGTFRAL
jgi:hypothetical protein